MTTPTKLPFPALLLLGALRLTACTKPQAPSAPRELTATGEPGALLLTWRAPEHDGGATVSGYRVECEPQEEGGAVSVEGLTARVSGLKAGASYRCIVGARNEVGPGPVAEVGPVRVPQVPAAPTAVVAVRGDSRARVTWGSRRGGPHQW